MKLLVLIGIGSGALITAVALGPASARTADTVEELAPYRSWTRITKEPVKGPGIPNMTTIDAGAAGG